MKRLICAGVGVLVSVFLINTTASADPETIALWTFEQTQPFASGQTISGILPEVGDGEASGFRTSSTTNWQSSAGNGSPSSFGATRWSSGDYFAFQISTAGMTDIALSFDQTRQSNGPTNWRIRYSIDGGATFVDFQDYSVANLTWSTTVPTAASSYSYALPEAVENQPILIVRLTALQTGGTTAGEAKVDDVHFTGIPEPASLGLVAVALLSLRRRR